MDLNLPTIRHRVETRQDSDFGKSKHEMDSIIEWQKSTEEYYRKIGAHVIDTSKPVPEVVDEILTAANEG